jgi:hypothetical protein
MHYVKFVPCHHGMARPQVADDSGKGLILHIGGSCMGLITNRHKNCYEMLDGSSVHVAQNRYQPIALMNTVMNLLH